MAAIAGAVAGVMRPDASVMARPIDQRHSAAQLVRGHVVEQYGVDAED